MTVFVTEVSEVPWVPRVSDSGSTLQSSTSEELERMSDKFNIKIV